MPQAAKYEQPVDWRCWANRYKKYTPLGIAPDYEAEATCNDPPDTDLGLCKRCYIALIGEWPPVSGKVRERD